MTWLSDDLGLWVQLAIASGWLGLVVVVAEMARRLGGARPEITRKIVHIGTSHIILIAWWLQIPATVGIVASILFSALTLLSYRLPLLPGIDSVGRKSLGTFFYAVSIGVLIALFWQTSPCYAVLGVLIMGWGDGLAALVGQRWGSHTYQLWDMKKSWEGSLTMAVASYSVASLVLWAVQGNMASTWLIPFAVAGVATGLESFSKWGIDNLTVPLGSGAIAYYLNQIVFH